MSPASCRCTRETCYECLSLTVNVNVIDQVYVYFDDEDDSGGHRRQLVTIMRARR